MGPKDISPLGQAMSHFYDVGLILFHGDEEKAAVWAAQMCEQQVEQEKKARIESEEDFS